MNTYSTTSAAGILAIITSTCIAAFYLWRVIRAIKSKDEEVAIVNGLRISVWSVVVLLSLWVFKDNLEMPFIIPVVILALVTPTIIYLSIDDADFQESGDSERTQ